MNTDTNLMPVSSMADIATAGELIAQSGLCGAKNPAEGFIVALTCQQRGIDIITFKETYHVMMGTIAKRADAMLADFLRGGGKHHIVERSAVRAAIELINATGTVHTFALTWDEACAEPFVYAGSPDTAAAQLKKPMAERQLKPKYASPRSRMQMLWARVVSDGVRAVDPRANQGSYTPEEMEADTPAIDITPQAPPKVRIDYVLKHDVIYDAASGNVTPSPAADPDYNICPIADDGCAYAGMLWSEVPLEHLKIALDIEHPAMTDGHRAYIQHTITQAEG